MGGFLNSFDAIVPGIIQQFGDDAGEGRPERGGAVSDLTKRFIGRSYSLAAVLSVSVAACGEMSPAGPSATAGTDVSCRRVASAFSTVTTQLDGSIATSETTCAFDPGIRSLSCTTQKTTQGLCPGTDDSRTEYSSIADLIDEAAVVGRILWTHKVSTTSVSMQLPNCGGERRALQNETVNQFDSQSRLAGATFTPRELSPSPRLLGTPTTVSYGSWDSQGRPTVEIAPMSTASTTYDDATRTKTTTTPGLTIVVRFDADGNTVEGRTIVPGGAVNAVMTIAATQLVCRQ
jgi:hypothetical protein